MRFVQSFVKAPAEPDSDYLTKRHCSIFIHDS
jgi:hypothetical protein